MSWRPEDKDWLKERKAYWKVVKPMLSHTRLYDSKDVRLIKEYYLYGPEKETLIHCAVGGDLHKVKATALLGAWLHPSDDVEEVKSEIKRFTYRDETRDGYVWIKHGYHIFYNLTHAVGVEKASYLAQYKLLGDSLFDGREQLMCQLLLPDSIEKDSQFLKKKNDQNQEWFDDHLTYKFGDLLGIIDTPDPMPHYVPQYRIPYILSCFKHGNIQQRAHITVERFCYVAEKIKAEPANALPVQVNSINEFESGLFVNKSEIPASTFEIFDKYRQLAKEKLLSEPNYLANYLGQSL
ncbi:hypothetical protein [Algibacillus agarilyticus]|uniref:hypothetical protein n=1 Tax=Algibacillus agarilyticus TaxID=2234133 RepID=UPI000DD01A44|nr:hypothetical protein [Algibacillus agarilyticus]